MQKHVIVGSRHTPLKNASIVNPMHDEDRISTTWIINRNLSAKETDIHIKQINEFAKLYNLEVSTKYPKHLSVVGTAANFSRALNIKLYNYKTDNYEYHATPDDISIPKTWQGKLDHILGLNTNKIAHTHFMQK